MDNVTQMIPKMEEPETANNASGGQASPGGDVNGEEQVGQEVTKTVHFDIDLRGIIRTELQKILSEMQPGEVEAAGEAQVPAWAQQLLGRIETLEKNLEASGHLPRPITVDEPAAAEPAVE